MEKELTKRQVYQNINIGKRDLLAKVSAVTVTGIVGGQLINNAKNGGINVTFSTPDNPAQEFILRQ